MNIHTSYNNYITLFFKISDEFMQNYDAETSCENRRIIHIIHSYFVYQTIIGLVFASHFFVFPYSPLHLTSEIDPLFMHPVIYFGYGFIWLMASVNVCMTFILICTILIIYYGHFVPVFSEEFRFGSTRQKSAANLHTIENFTKMYRAMEVIVLYQNQLSAGCLIPIQTSFWMINIFGVLTLDRNWDRLDNTGRLAITFFTGGILVIWTVILKVAGNMGVWNRKTRMSWQRGKASGQVWLGCGNKKDRLFVTKFQRSCKPIYIAYGKFFVLKPVSVLAYLRKVTRGTFKALLMSRKG